MDFLGQRQMTNFNPFFVWTFLVRIVASLERLLPKICKHRRTAIQNNNESDVFLRFPIALLCLGLAACGGGSSPAFDLSLHAERTQIAAGSEAISITASTNNVNETITWQLAANSLGSLDKAAGPTVRFTPPAADRIAARTNTTVIATAGNVSKSIELAIYPPSAMPGLYRIAGNLGGPGTNDGVGTAARFIGIKGIAIGTTGTLYVTESDSFRSTNAIRRISPDGTVSTLMRNASGIADGSIADARLHSPGRIATDPAGNLYVIDGQPVTGPNATILRPVIRKISADGTVSTLSTSIVNSTGSRSLSADHVVADSSGNLFLAAGTTIWKMSPAGDLNLFAGKLDESMSIDGIGSAARFRNISSMAIDSSGNILVTDLGNGGSVRKITPEAVVTTLAGYADTPGNADGAGNAARFNVPRHVTIDGAGNAYVVDYWLDAETNRYTEQRIRKITSTGIVTTIATGIRFGLDNNTAQIIGLVADASGNLYIAAENSGAENTFILKMNANGSIVSFAGEATYVNQRQDGTGQSAQFLYPKNMAADADGNLYVIESVGFEDLTSDEYPGLVLRKISSAGQVMTLAAPGTWFGQPDVQNNGQYFDNPSGIAVDSAGNIYISNTSSGRLGGYSGGGTILKISPQGFVTTFAGTRGKNERLDGTGSGAHLAAPVIAGFDNAGNLYIQDLGVRKISPQGVVTTITTYGLENVAVDSAGNVYGTDRFIDKDFKKISMGTIVSIPGTAGTVGHERRIPQPSSIAADPAGNLYVADRETHTVSKITPSGEITTIVGIAGSRGTVLGNPGRLDKPYSMTWLDQETLAIISGKGVLKLRLP